jgi:quercetin dioxygenase-like cupin family protein
MDSTEIEKGKAHILVDVTEYVPNAVLSKTIVKKLTGNVTVSSFDAGEEVGEKRLHYDVFVQVIDGEAEIIINGKKINLKLGEGMIIPAHATHEFLAGVKFKMISTIIKSGYED